MTLVDHLSELRRRIFICIAAIVAGSAVGFYFSGQLVSILRARCRRDSMARSGRSTSLPPVRPSSSTSSWRWSLELSLRCR